MVEKNDSLVKWQDDLSEMLSQHIYKQNDTFKKVWDYSKKLMKFIEESGFSYKDYIGQRKIDLYEHLIFTAILSYEIAVKLNLEREKKEHLFFGCLIHDIGLRYVSIPYQNCKLEMLTPKEIYEVKKHTILGYTSIEKESWIPQIVKSMVLSHHELIDGTGYPLKQKNEEIECKIIQVTDAFDRIFSGIETEQGSIEDAISLLEQNKGLKYDKEIVTTMFEVIGKE